MRVIGLHAAQIETRARDDPGLAQARERAPEEVGVRLRAARHDCSPVPVTTSSSTTLSPCVPYLNDATPMPAIDERAADGDAEVVREDGRDEVAGLRGGARGRATRRPPRRRPSGPKRRRGEFAAWRSSVDRIPPSLMARRLWLCAAPRVETVRPCSRAKTTVAATSRADAGETTSRGVPVEEISEIGEEARVELIRRRDGAFDPVLELLVQSVHETRGLRACDWPGSGYLTGSESKTHAGAARGGGCGTKAHDALRFRFPGSFNSPRLRRGPPLHRARYAAPRGDHALTRCAEVLRPGPEALLRLQPRRGDPRVP